MNNANRTSKEEADSSLLKQEDHHDHHKTKKHQASTSSSNSLTAQWLRSKDPRIFGVSRAFGGKDRHSKVCTVRGLRDRRVRLSASTAIQLYDLQDRLGFNQPSKVVDWLLDAAKHEIDKLPPLQIPPGSFSFCHQQPSMNNNNQVTTITSQQNEQGLFSINESFLQNQLETSNSVMSKSKVGKVAIDEKANWNRREGEGEQEEDDDEDRYNLLTIGKNHHHHHHPSFLGLLSTMPLGYNVNNNQWEANSSEVSHSVNLGFENQQTDLHSSTNVVPFSALSSTLSLSTGPKAPHHHQPYFPSSHIGAIMDMDPRQMNQYQMLSSSNYLMMMNSKLRSPNSSETYYRNKDQVFPSR